MKVLTYTSYKRHWDLYTEIHGSIVVNSCQIELTQKNISLLSKVSIIVYKADKRTGVENTNFICSQRVLIQLMTLMQKSGWQSYNKGKTGNHLKLKTYGWSYQKTTHSWLTILFLSRLVYKKATLKRLR